LALFGFPKGKRKPDDVPGPADRADRGILVFENTSEVIQAENLLKSQGCDVRVMGPPPEIRQGFYLVIEFPLIEKLQIFRIRNEAKAIPWPPWPNQP
jgi:hypothetical protein